MPRFDKATYLSLLFKFILSERFSYSLWRSDVLLFSEFINIVSILFYNLIEFIILLYTYFFSNLFARYKEYISCLISFSKFSDVLLAFTCARAIGNLWSICLGVTILKLKWSETLSEKPVHLILIGNNLLSKAVRTLSLPPKKIISFLRTSFFLVFSLDFLVLLVS